MSSGGSSTTTKTSTYKPIETGGLYGSFDGTKYTPTDIERQMVDYANAQIPKTVEEIYNPTYSSIQFQNAQQQIQNQAADALQNQVINPVYQAGTSRGSTADVLGSTLANKTVNLQYQAMLDEDARQQQQLATLLNLRNTPLQTLQGLTNIGGTSSSTIGPATNNTANITQGLSQALGAYAASNPTQYAGYSDLYTAANNPSYGAGNVTFTNASYGG